MRHALTTSVAGACALALAASATAFARAGDRTFTSTYPVASQLCERAREGSLPTKLEGNRTAVITACDTLENAFGPLVSTVDAAESAFLQTLSTQRGLVAAACPRPVTDTAGCQAARETRTTTDAAALLTRSAAGHAVSRLG